MNPVIVAMCAIYGAFAVGVLFGIRIGHDAHDDVVLVDLSEPPSAVGPVMRTRECAPFGVSPIDRPWDWVRDGEAA